MSTLDCCDCRFYDLCCYTKVDVSRYCSKCPLNKTVTDRAVRLEGLKLAESALALADELFAYVESYFADKWAYRDRLAEIRTAIDNLAEK